MTDPTEKADTWMPLWIGAYLADTMKLTTLQHGAYFLLLLAYWRERAALNDSDDELRSITKTDKAEWKKLRPVLEKFFVVKDGVWWHKRVEAEMVKANNHKEAATSKAKAAAGARWKDHKKNAPSIPQAPPQAELEDLHDEYPPPTPTPLVVGIPTLVAKEVNKLNTHNGVFVDNSGAPDSLRPVCVVLENSGIQGVNILDPEFTRLTSDSRITVGHWQWAASHAVQKSNPKFAFVLGIVRNRVATEHAPPADVARTTTPAPPGIDPTLAKLDREAPLLKTMPADFRAKLADLKRGSAAH